MKLLVFATEIEALPTIELLSARSIDSHCYQFEDGYLIITGMGICAAQYYVTKYLLQLDCASVTNFGIVGALNHSLQLGEIYEISTVDKYVPLPKTIDLESSHFLDITAPTLHLPGASRLLSSDYPIHDKKIKNALAQKWDLVDMEGYGVAYAAKSADKPLTICKVVSDFASDGGRALLKRQIEECSWKLAKNVAV